MSHPTPTTPDAPNFGKYTGHKIALGNNRFLLPGGAFFNGRLLRTVALRPTNGFDEEAVGTTEVRAASHRITDTLLSRTITSIEDITDPNLIAKIVPEFTVGDRVGLLFMLQKISSGDTIPMELSCPNGHRFHVDFDIDKIEFDAYPEGYPREIPVKLKHGARNVGEEALSYDVVLRLPLGRDEQYMEGADNNPGLLRSKLLEICVKSIGKASPPNPMALKGMTAADRKLLEKTIDDCNPGPNLYQSYACTRCGTAVRGVARPTNFFGG